MRNVARYRRISRARLHFIIFESDPESTELLMSFFMFLIAAAFFVYGPAMLQNPAFTLLGAISGQTSVWGFGTLLIAVSKLLAALYDNSWWRVASVAAGAAVWSLISGSLWASGISGIGTLIYPAFAGVSIWLAWRIGWRKGRKEQVE